LVKVLACVGMDVKVKSLSWQCSYDQMVWRYIYTYTLQWNMGALDDSISLLCHYNENGGMIFHMTTMTSHMHCHITCDTHLIKWNQWKMIWSQICLCWIYINKNSKKNLHVNEK
jgi:hypothetical protein